MKVVIPAKVCSSRVVNKNWRPFYGEKSLVEIAIAKLKKAGFRGQDIYVTSEDAKCLLNVKRSAKVQTVIRDPLLCRNDTQITTVIRSVAEKIGSPEEFAWCQVTSPTFDQYADVMFQWKKVKQEYDSLAVAFPCNSYRMTPVGGTFHPIGWSFGSNHISSQEQCNWYMPFTFSIMTRNSLHETGYYVGRNPYWYKAASRHIDIDTPTDFFDAQAVFSARNPSGSMC